jgi:hypothetical protein
MRQEEGVTHAFVFVQLFLYVCILLAELDNTA